MPEGTDVIHITHFPPPVDELTDEEDFDDDILDDDYRDPSFLPPEVSGTVELHQYDEETDEESDSVVTPPSKKSRLTSTKQSKLPPQKKC